MEKYLGVKLIEAEPALKGFNVDDEVKNFSADLLEEGYKVVYEDGYTSWSPKDVFEKAYRKYKDTSLAWEEEDGWADWQIRVFKEHAELHIKILNLEDLFYNDCLIRTFSNEEQIRLKQQLLAMQYYKTILLERIENFK